ncbi:MAG: dihydrofolate reductase family protein [Vitreoscilla sp.]
MAKLIVSNIVSLDGYIAGPGGNPAVLPMDQAFDAYNLERLRSAGTLVLGRKTFEMFRGFWPAVQHAADAPPVLREISRLNSHIPKTVVSDSLVVEPGSAWSDASVLRREHAIAGLARAKASSDKDLLVFGSRTLWNSLLAAGLVDELHLMVGNVLVGSGEPAFTSQAPQPLTLIAERRFAGSQNVLLQYACGAGPQ